MEDTKREFVVNPVTGRAVNAKGPLGRVIKAAFATHGLEAPTVRSKPMNLIDEVGHRKTPTATDAVAAPRKRSSSSHHHKTSSSSDTDPRSLEGGSLRDVRPDVSVAAIYDPLADLDVVRRVAASDEISGGAKKRKKTHSKKTISGGGSRSRSRSTPSRSARTTASVSKKLREMTDEAHDKMMESIKLSRSRSRTVGGGGRSRSRSRSRTKKVRGGRRKKKVSSSSSVAGSRGSYGSDHRSPKRGSFR